MNVSYYWSPGTCVEDCRTPNCAKQALIMTTLRPDLVRPR